MLFAFLAPASGRRDRGAVSDELELQGAVARPKLLGVLLGCFKKTINIYIQHGRPCVTSCWSFLFWADVSESPPCLITLAMRLDWQEIDDGVDADLAIVAREGSSRIIHLLRVAAISGTNKARLLKIQPTCPYAFVRPSNAMRC